ncbi:MAG: hypothetical protein V4467_03885 [Patescibacteria group bacterium]
MTSNCYLSIVLANGNSFTPAESVIEPLSSKTGSITLTFGTKIFTFNQKRAKLATGDDVVLQPVIGTDEVTLESCITSSGDWVLITPSMLPALHRSPLRVVTRRHRATR